MPNISDLSDVAPKLKSYLKEHFDGVATAWFCEPFSNNPREPNGLTVVLNREPKEEERRWLRDEFEGFAMRWETPSQKFSLPPKADITISIEMKREKTGF